MAKRSSNRPEVSIRELPPRTIETGETVKIVCPFCEPPHPLAVGKPSPCGTMMKVTAIQTIYPARTVQKYNLKCVKCQKGGGKMIQFNQGYVHLHECTPGTKLMTEPPEFSRFARIVFGLPPFLRDGLERWTGKARQVKEIDPQGAETGQVLGYFFYRSTQGGSHAADRQQ